MSTELDVITRVSQTKLLILVELVEETRPARFPTALWAVEVLVSEADVPILSATPS